MSDNVQPEMILSWLDGADITERRILSPAELPLTIGRESTNDIWINSSQVTRQHARLSVENGKFWIEDLKSRNGVWINNKRIQEKTVLAEGTIFRIRPFEFSVLINTKAQPLNIEELQTENLDATIPLPDTAGVHIRLAWRSPDSEETAQADFMAPVTIGRNESCNIQLPDKNISRQHARIEIQEDKLVIVDQGSVNGLKVNGDMQPVTHLRADDEIKIGPYTLRVLYVDPILEATSVQSAGRFASSDPREDVAELAQPVRFDDAAVTLPPAAKQSAAFDAAGSTLPPTFKYDIPPGVSAYSTEPIIPLEEPGEEGLQSTPNFPPASFQNREVDVDDLQRSNFPVETTTYLAIGGGLGSFVWVDHLQIYGADPRDIVSIGFEPKPYGRYRRLCKNSHIPGRERLRSNSDSCPDNVWGWPGYAVRESWHEFRRGNFKASLGLLWQIFNEPTFSDTYTPRSGNVFRSIDREAERIGWQNIWRPGRVKAIRKTTDGRYAIAYTETQSGRFNGHRLLIAQHVHISVGYPAIRLLPDLYEYRIRTKDFTRVVNAYEKHDHIYKKLQDQGGVVLVRGRGIVASRILQRLYEARRQNPNIAILHLMRSPVAEGHRYGYAQRQVENHWEFQPFNWPKSCWSGDLRKLLERATDEERQQLLNDWGGTTTADRTDWRDIIRDGLREGWYHQSFGAVKKVDYDRNSNALITSIRGVGDIQSDTHLNADFIIDATGLVSEIDSHPLLDDLLKHYRLKRNPQGRFKVRNDFEIQGMRNQNGRMYAAGVITLGGPYAAVDSFLGLQYAALRAVDSLTATGAPGLRYLDGLRSIRQWLRWARGVQP